MVSRGVMSLSQTVDVNGVPGLYVFNCGADGGFVVTPADDCVEAVLGYSDVGSIDSLTMPPQLRYWLDGLAREVELMRGWQKPAVVMAGAAQAERADIMPLCNTWWNQGAPFNNDCPVYSGQRCVTGCVATAMAQVIKYYNYPSKGTGVARYTWTDPGSVEHELEYDFEAHVFDWSSMAPYYTSASTSAPAVANLMYACGVAVAMNYSPSASGASSFKPLGALVNHFKFDIGAEYCARDYYGNAQWEQMIYDNLVNYGPVLMSGANDFSGHEFVCDGYKADGNLFHFNWGWGSVSDGYFKLSALDPSSQGIGGSASGYNFWQVIVIKLRRPVAGSKPVYKLCAPQGVELTVSGQSVTVRALPDANGYNGGMYNYSVCDIQGFKHGLEFTTPGGVKTYLYSANNYSLTGNRGYSSYTVNASGLADGTYSVRPVFKTADGDVHYISLPQIASQTFDVTVKTEHEFGGAGSTPATTQILVASNTPGQLSVTSFSQNMPNYVSEPVNLKVTFSNPNATDYSNGVALYVGKVADGSFNPLVAGGTMRVNVEPNSSVTLDYVSPLYTLENNTALTAGNYQAVWVDNEGNILDGTAYSFSVVKGTAGTAQINNLTAVNASGADLKNLEFNGTLVKKSGDYYNKDLTLYVFPYPAASGTVSVGRLSGISTPLSNAVTSSPVQFKGMFIADGRKDFFAQVHDGTGWISNQARFSIDPTTGVSTLECAEPDVMEVRYYTLGGQELSGEPREPGVYIVKRDYSDGTIRTSRESVK